MPNCDFNKVARQLQISLWRGCFLVNLLHIFRTPVSKNTSEGVFPYLLLLNFIFKIIQIFNNPKNKIL